MRYVQAPLSIDGPLALGNFSTFQCIVRLSRQFTRRAFNLSNEPLPWVLTLDDRTCRELGGLGRLGI